MTKKIKIQKNGYLPLISNKKPKSGAKFPKGNASIFKVRLTEQQRFRRNFGLKKKQFAQFIQKPLNSVDLSKKICQKLDYFIYTLYCSNSLYTTLPQIRQKIYAGHILVNGVKEKRPNYVCKPIDTIQILKQKHSLNKSTHFETALYAIDAQKIA